jgi:hypothetical protein
LLLRDFLTGKIKFENRTPPGRLDTSDHKIALSDPLIPFWLLLPRKILYLIGRNLQRLKRNPDWTRQRRKICEFHVPEADGRENSTKSRFFKFMIESSTPDGRRGRLLL